MRLVREATLERLRVLWKAGTSRRLVFQSLGWILVFAAADVLIVQGVFGEAARNEVATAAMAQTNALVRDLFQL